jgi:hypothetical protein
VTSRPGWSFAWCWPGACSRRRSYGVQRFVSLGYSSLHTSCTPHDGIEVERRMCKWIVNQASQPIPLSFAASRNGIAPHDETGITPATLEALRQK